MNEFQLLLKTALNDTRPERNISLNMLRAELYKLYYHDQLFDLNVKGDSAEFLSVLLKMIHISFVDPNFRAQSTYQTFDDELDIPCSDKCSIHQKCYLNVK
jgi:hypothetical protein